MIELVEITPKTPAKSEGKEPIERTDDPVRMYLREMRRQSLLNPSPEEAEAPEPIKRTQELPQ